MRARATAASDLQTVDEVLVPDPVAVMTDATFFESLQGHATIVELWSPWCEPCKALSPIVDKLARRHATEHLHFMRVNVDECPNLATALSVRIIPSLLLLNDTGDVIDRLGGLPRLRRIKQLIAQVSSATSTTDPT
ncbi:MAG: thioredoxin family protein [Ilumatobacteraceae bacterium]